MFCQLYNQSPERPMGLFTRSHRTPPATASIQCLETQDHFPWPGPHSCVLHECMCVAVAESVRSGSVAVVSGIYYSDHWWLQVYLKDLHPPHVELAQPVQFYSIRAWLLCFGWYQHWWAMRMILSRPEFQVWQEWKWNQAFGIHRGSPFQVLTPLTGA